MAGHTHPQRTTTPGILWLVLSSLLLAACGSAPPAKTYTIGVVNYTANLEQVLIGFKARMAALGYGEGSNITYLYPGVLAPDPQVLAQAVQRLMTRNVDLFLTLGTLPTIVTKQAVAGTTIPVVFAPVVTPVKEGVVESIARPGGNVTGIQTGDAIPKALEWLHRLVPHATRIYTLYHPRDKVALSVIAVLPTTASSLGLALVPTAVHSQEEARAVIETIPRDAAIFLIPTPSLEPLGTLLEVAVQRGIPVGANNHAHITAGALVTYAGSFLTLGHQAARLVDQVFKGTRPADLPVETAEGFLHINLQTAAAIGLEIPDGILRQADAIVR